MSLDRVLPDPHFRERHPRVARLGRYAVAGAVGTGVNAAVFLLLRTAWDDPLGANLVALVVSTLVSTEVNRRFTFEGVPERTWRAHVQTAGMVAFYAVYSSAVLLAVGALVDDPSPVLESAAVAAASVLGGAVRYLLLRYWVFPAGDRPHGRLRGRAARVWHRHRALRVVVALATGAVLLLTACAPFAP